MSVKDLLSIQVGKETTWGTSATATAKLMGITDITLQPDVQGKVYQDIRGSLAPGYLATINKVAGAGKVSGLVTYEDFAYWLDALFGTATPTGAGPYVYAYTAPLAAAATPRIQTVYYGDGTNCYKLLGGLPTKLTVKGNNNTELTYDVELIGKQVTTGSLAALSDRTVNVATGNDCSIYIDAWGGSVGATAFTQSFSFELTVGLRRVLKPYLGSLTPSGYVDNRYMGTLKLSLELVAASKAFLDAIIAGTLSQYQVRIKATTGANAIVQLDFAGSVVKSPELFPDKDGVVTIDMELEATYNAGLANWFKASVTNGVSVLP